MVRREGRLCGIDHTVSSFPDGALGMGMGDAETRVSSSRTCTVTCWLGWSSGTGLSTHAVRKFSTDSLSGNSVPCKQESDPDLPPSLNFRLLNFSHSLHSHKSTPAHCSHGQLRYDGYEAAASSLSGIVSSFPPTVHQWLSHDNHMTFSRL